MGILKKKCPKKEGFRGKSFFSFLHPYFSRKIILQKNANFFFAKKIVPCIIETSFHLFTSSSWVTGIQELTLASYVCTPPADRPVLDKSLAKQASKGMMEMWGKGKRKKDNCPSTPPSRFSYLPKSFWGLLL